MEQSEIDDDGDSEAFKRYRACRESLAAGDFSAALASGLASNQLEVHPKTLECIGDAYQGLDDGKTAVVYYLASWQLSQSAGVGIKLAAAMIRHAPHARRETVQLLQAIRARYPDSRRPAELLQQLLKEDA